MALPQMLLASLPVDRSQAAAAAAAAAAVAGPDAAITSGESFPVQFSVITVD
jgi:hypothetical protein